MNTENVESDYRMHEEIGGMQELLCRTNGFMAAENRSR